MENETEDLGMVTVEELSLLAAFMLETHGEQALFYADCAAAELEWMGEPVRAAAWRALKDVAQGMLDGDIPTDGITVH